MYAMIVGVSDAEILPGPLLVLSGHEHSGEQAVEGLAVGVLNLDLSNLQGHGAKSLPGPIKFLGPASSPMRAEFGTTHDPFAVAGM